MVSFDQNLMQQTLEDTIPYTKIEVQNPLHTDYCISDDDVKLDIENLIS